MFKAFVPDVNEQGIVLVRGVPFGGPSERDLHGQYFSQRTDFLPHLLPLPPVFHFHGAKTGSTPVPIAETIDRMRLPDGIWYKVRLFLDSVDDVVREKANSLWEAAKAGTLFASSGAVEATIKVATGGEILQWLVSELSLINTKNPGERPANFHATVTPIKADLNEVETGDVTLDTLSINGISDKSGSGEEEGHVTVQQAIASYAENMYNEIRAYLPDDDRLRELMLETYRDMFGSELIPTVRSVKKMPDDIVTPPTTASPDQFATLQQQVAEMATQIAGLQTGIQQRDAHIGELESLVTTKSAEVEMRNHEVLVDTWLQQGLLSPAERDPMLNVLSFAFQADTATKGDIGFVEAIKGLVAVRPKNPLVGPPAGVFNNTGDDNPTHPDLVIDETNVNRLKRYAEIPAD